MNIHIEILKREFQKRVSKNNRFSLRAFSKIIDVHPSALSRVFNGKAELTSSGGVEIARRLKLSTDESRRFVSGILKARNERERERLGELLEAPYLKPLAKKLSASEYASVLTLPYFALLTLSKTFGFNSDPSKIAEQLNLSVETTKSMIEHALRHGLFSRNEQGALVNQEEHMMVVDTAETAHVRRELQAQVLAASESSLQSDSSERRCHYSMTMAIDSSKLEYARQCILDFMLSLADELEVGDRDQVATVAVSLFPNSRP